MANSKWTSRILFGMFLMFAYLAGLAGDRGCFCQAFALIVCTMFILTSLIVREDLNL